MAAVFRQRTGIQELDDASWLLLSERQEWILALVSALRPRNARGTACGTQKYKIADEVCKVWCGHFGEALKVKKDELEASVEKKRRKASVSDSRVGRT